MNAPLVADADKLAELLNGAAEWHPFSSPTSPEGSTYVDITAVNETTGKTVRVQTIDTLADGITPTKTEGAAIARIREKFPNDELWIIPKR